MQERNKNAWTTVYPPDITSARTLIRWAHEHNRLWHVSCRAETPGFVAEVELTNDEEILRLDNTGYWEAVSLKTAVDLLDNEDEGK